MSRATARKSARTKRNISKKQTHFRQVEAPKSVESALQIAQRTVALVVTFSGIGNRRKVSNSQVDVDADKEWIAVSKRLIDADELEAIRSLDGEVRRYIDNTALPAMLKKGVYLLPVELIEPVTTKLREYDIQRRVLVKRFVAAYAELVQEARQRLRELFNATDYLHADDVEHKFRLRWQLIQFTTPASLEQISKELFEQEKAKAEAQWAETRDTIQQLLRSNLAELIDHMVDRLEPDDRTGSRKVFKDSAISSMQAFLQTFNARNVTDDAEMARLVKEAKGLLSGVSAKQLRNSSDLREEVHDGFAKIKQMLDPLVIVKPARAISFEEV